MGEHRNSLTASLARLQTEARLRIEANRGIGSYFDQYVLSLDGEQVPDEIQRVSDTVHLRNHRFVSALVRIEIRPYSDIPGPVWVYAQGTSTTPLWQGRSLLKSPYDMAVYVRLLQELRPQTVLELGSGSGGSALWLESMCSALGMAPHIVSVDRAAPEPAHGSAVQFWQGDVTRLREDFMESLGGLAHPWLVIEDTHDRLKVILDGVDQLVLGGDYVVIEDSFGLQGDAASFLRRARHEYVADNELLDFFGVNATSAMNTIWQVR